MPVLHFHGPDFHGTKDTFVPFEMTKDKAPAFLKLKSVDDSIRTWVKLNGCEEKPKIDTLSKDGDEMRVTRKSYGGGKDGAEVVLVVIEDGGHLAGDDPAGRAHRQVGEKRLGQRPDVGVLPEAQIKVKHPP